MRGGRTIGAQPSLDAGSIGEGQFHGQINSRQQLTPEPPNLGGEVSPTQFCLEYGENSCEC